MQPATISFCALPDFLYSAISRIESTDSFCAGSMKLQVLTTRTSASPARGVSSYPARARIPIITSLSTRFFGHPRLTNPTFGITARSFGLNGKTRFYHTSSRYPGGASASRKHSSRSLFVPQGDQWVDASGATRGNEAGGQGHDGQ